MPIYIDTRALAKRYLLERGSKAFDAFLQDCDDCVISALGSTEFESILRCERLSDARHAEQARKDSLPDLQTTLWVVRPFAMSSFPQAATQRGLTVHDFSKNPHHA